MLSYLDSTPFFILFLYLCVIRENLDTRKIISALFILKTLGRTLFLKNRNKILVQVLRDGFKISNAFAVSCEPWGLYHLPLLVPGKQ